MEKATPNLELITRYFKTLTSRQLEQLEALGDLYSDWNNKINVISRKDIGGLYEKHVLHSLSIAAIHEFGRHSSVLDIGTGGGFPGIPLAIYFPETDFHLVDSIAKKLKVVEEVVAATGLRNVSVQHVRAESISGRSFDYAVSRAVAPLKELWKWSRPLLRKNNPGLHDARSAPGLICLKGGDLTLEIRESRTRPSVTELHSMFAEPFFREKYMLHIPL